MDSNSGGSVQWHISHGSSSAALALLLCWLWWLVPRAASSGLRSSLSSHLQQAAGDTGSQRLRRADGWATEPPDELLAHVCGSVT